MEIPEQEMASLSDPEIARGEIAYHDYCAACHGMAVRSGGVIPDLRQMTPEMHAMFNGVVLEGILAPKGMSSFSDVLTEEDMVFLHEYVRARAHQDREVALGNQEQPRWTWLDSIR